MFPENRAWHSLPTDYQTNFLRTKEMVWEKKKEENIKLSSAEILTQHAKLWLSGASQMKKGFS